MADCVVFVKRALTQIVAACGSSSKLSKIKEECKARLDDLDESQPTTGRLSTSTVQQYVQPLQAVCEQSDPKLVVIALDCLQKLMEYGYIRDVDTDVLHGGTPRGKRVRLVELVVSIVVRCTKLQVEEVNLQVIRCMLTAVMECHAHDTALNNIITTMCNMMTNTRDVKVPMIARTHLLQITNEIFKRLESVDLTADGVQCTGASGAASPATDSLASSVEFTTTLPSGNGTPPASPGSPTTSGSAPVNGFTPTTTPPEISDARILFTSLCKMAKAGVTESTSPDSPQMKKCLSALDFIHNILQKAGQVFRNTPLFLNGIRDPLCHCLLKNCASTVPNVFKVSLNIFTCLLIRFKRYLKHEVGLLLTNVFLPLLESTNTPYDQKTAVIQALQKVLSKPQVIMDIFVNYDCDIRATDIFKRIVESMSRMVQTEHLESNWVSVAQAVNIKQLALSTLVTILRSMVEWVFKKEADRADIEGDGAGLSVTEGERQRKMKSEVAQAVEIFNKKPKRGIEYLTTHQLMDNSPVGLGTFLRYAVGLDAEVVGNYLGEEDAFARAALTTYVETLDMGSVMLDDALRRFLMVFKLPVEGQKIERILETWSEVYYRKQPEVVFKCEDAVHIVAVAIVMLNTDLHNPQVKVKMTKQQFVSQLRGINDGEDLPLDMLQAMYDRIWEKPFQADGGPLANSVAADHGTLAVLSQGPLGGSLWLTKKERKQLQYSVESDRLLRQAKDMLESSMSTSGPPSAYWSAKEINYVQSMFSMLWHAMLAAFSIQLEMATDNMELIGLCLEGLECGIRIAAMFEMATEREAYVQSLTKMTYITSVKQIGPKNIEGIQTLIRVANDQGESLQNSWLPVIRTISHLERLHLVGRAANAGRTTVVDGPVTHAPEEAQLIANRIDDVAINKIFTNSVHLTQEGIVVFMRALCAVCREEVSDPHPRLYCLQKVVEVATDNLGQRIVSMWAGISALLVEIGCSTDADSAFTAIDSLRQMVIKCLARPEILDCQLQPELLEPFYQVLTNEATSHSTKELILCCYEQIVLMKVHVIGEGWTVVFRVLTAATTINEATAMLALNITTRVLLEHPTVVVQHLQVATDVLLACATSTFPAVSSSAVEPITRVVESLASTCAEHSDVWAALHRVVTSPPAAEHTTDAQAT